jgi:hypothetical protein
MFAEVARRTIRDHHGLPSSITKHRSLRMHLSGDNPCQASELADLKYGTSEVRQIRFFQPEERPLFRGVGDTLQANTDIVRAWAGLGRVVLGARLAQG